MDYWVFDWARLRQDEVIRLPQSYKVHSDFLKHINKEDLLSTFIQINSLFTKVYGDIAESPREFGMPLYEKKDYRFFSKQERDTRDAPYRPFMLLYYLFVSGDLENQTLRVSSDKFKTINPVKNIHFLFKKLEDYGFKFDGLKKYKLSENDILVSYSGNPIILPIVKMMVDKAYNTNRLADFLCCHFRLLQDDINTANYGHGADDVADRVDTDAEKKFIYKMDETLMSMGMFRKSYGGIECHGLAYYDRETVMNSKGPYLFRMVSRSMDIAGTILETEKLLLMLRIRNVEKCVEYLKVCPDSVKDIFMCSDEGCANRSKCRNGISYEIDGMSYWKCGCCSPTLRFKPKIDDIPHYIKLVELGSKK